MRKREKKGVLNFNREPKHTKHYVLWFDKIGMGDKETKIIRETILTLLNLLGVPPEEAEVSDYSRYRINKEELSKGAFSVNIKSQEPGILIGQRGDNLAALQHLARLIIKIKLKKPIHLTLDVNDYKLNKIDSLKRLAENVAETVSRTKRTFILQPMRAYDRRVIHLTLSSRLDITTSSAGEEPERRVEVKPV